MAKENLEFSKYERARIIGARGLQISMDAPLLVDMSEDELNGVNFDPLRIAEKELSSGVLPISVNRPMPKRREDALHKIKIEETKITDADKQAAEDEEEKEISEGGEMMELNDSGEEPEVENEESEDDSDSFE